MIHMQFVLLMFELISQLFFLGCWFIDPPPGAADPLHSDASNAAEFWSYVFESLRQSANFEGAAAGNGDLLVEFFLYLQHKIQPWIWIWTLT